MFLRIGFISARSTPQDCCCQLDNVAISLWRWSEIPKSEIVGFWLPYKGQVLFCSKKQQRKRKLFLVLGSFISLEVWRFCSRACSFFCHIQLLLGTSAIAGKTGLCALANREQSQCWLDPFQFLSSIKRPKRGPPPSQSRAHTPLIKSWTEQWWAGSA